MAPFDLFILQGFHIKQKELIVQKLILILQGIGVLFSKNSSTIISLRYFSLSFATMDENNLRLLFYLFLFILNLILIILSFI
jgi:hypothetical protein